jgi:hypothetical protein
MIDPKGHSTCECWGFLRWGHRGPCKHIKCLKKLLAEGKLPVATLSALQLQDLAEERQRRMAELDDL